MSFSEGIFHSFVKPSASPSHFTQNILKISKPLFRLHIHITTTKLHSYSLPPEGAKCQKADVGKNNKIYVDTRNVAVG